MEFLLKSLLLNSNNRSKNKTGVCIDTEIKEDGTKLITLTGNGKIEETINLGRNGMIRIDGNVSIESDCPINCYGDVIIEGVGNSILTLSATDYIQPCIGTRSILNEDYSISLDGDYILSDIILNNIILSIKSVNENFTIGSFGLPNVPNIHSYYNSKTNIPEYFYARVLDTNGIEYVQDRIYGNINYGLR